jgi:acylphosphatase
MARYRLRVTGVVQGVGFRWFTLRTARRLDLAGRVRNDVDGSVEVVVEGSDGAVERFIEALRVGPEGSSVAEVRRSADPARDPLPMPFEIEGRR